MDSSSYSNDDQFINLNTLITNQTAFLNISSRQINNSLGKDMNQLAPQLARHGADSQAIGSL